jgi:GT2 family glycosyltransferase/glycosyltransferase involved in cell wall biosynthesis
MPREGNMPVVRESVGHIIFVTPDVVGPVKNGGIGTACFHYARTLADAGYKVEILFSGEIGIEKCRYWSDWYAERDIAFFALDHVPGYTVPVYGGRWYTERAERIMQFLRQRPCDYLIFQDWHANGLWTARARRMGMAFGRTAIAVITHSPNQWQKTGMHSFGTYPVEEHGLEWAEKEQIAAVDILISPSNHMVGWLRDHGYTLPERVAICPYTFEDPLLPGHPEAPNRDHLIFFGRLETRKGLHLLGGALRNLKRMGGRLPRQVSFLGKYADVEGVRAQDYLRDLCAELESVEFRIEAEYDYIQAMDYIRGSNAIVVIPSVLDNFPLTVIESIANGFCFIASEAGGIPEMVDATVCFPATVEGLQSKLAKLDQVDFAGLRHRYDPLLARTTWLKHVARIVNEVRAMPEPARVLREEIPKISICMPFYRHDCYIRRTIGAFLRMNLPQLQFVVVDDGTPPTERANFDRLARELEPLGHIFYRQPNAGAGAARNRAAKLAANDLLLFFDADNVPFPDFVEKLWQAMQRIGADSVAAPYIGVKPMTRRPLPEDTVLRFQAQGGPMAIALLDNVVGDSCSLVRRRVFDELGGFSERRGSWEDWEFFLRVIAAGYRHFIYPEPIFFYTVDINGRNLRAKEYENRMSLLTCLDHMPVRSLSEAVRAFAVNTHVTRQRA